MANDSKLRHIAQSSNHRADNDVKADVEREHDSAPKRAESKTTTVPTGGYPSAPPFMLPEYHKRMHARTKHQAHPVTTSAVEVQTVETTITIRVVQITTDRSL